MNPCEVRAHIGAAHFIRSGSLTAVLADFDHFVRTYAPVKRGSSHAKKAARIAWLRAHPEVWKLSKAGVVAALKDAHLVARTTYAGDCRVDNWLREAGKR